jgi:hypothetical protein
MVGEIDGKQIPLLAQELKTTLTAIKSGGRVAGCGDGLREKKKLLTHADDRDEPRPADAPGCRSEFQ